MNISKIHWIVLIAISSIIAVLLLVSSANLIYQGTTGFVHLSLQEDFSDWVSWAKDAHNSRIADDVIAPPFKIKWQADVPNKLNHAMGSRLYYQDGRIFAVLPWHGESKACVAAYSADTGESLWEASCGGVHGSNGIYSIGHDFVWGGNDHSGNFRVDTETGNQFIMAGYGGAGVMESFSNIDSSGIYGYGNAGVDSLHVSVKALDAIFEPIAHPTNNGKFNGGFEFTGSKGNDYLNLGNVLNPEDQDWTAMLWFKWNGSEGYQTLFSKGHSSFSTLYKVRIIDSQVQYSWEPDYPGYWYGDFSCSPGEWCHLAITYDHQHQKMYKNGELVYSKETTGDIGSNSEPFYIGGQREVQSFDGMIDELAVFNKALSEEEISQMYNSEIIPDENTQLLFHFNNESAYNENEKFVYDFSGNENHAEYDGHLNVLVRWSNSRNERTSGVPLSFYGEYNGFGQPAIYDNILYVPDGILWAYNVTNGDVVWQKGCWPLQSEVGKVKHYSEVTYSNGTVYVIGEECLDAGSGVRWTSGYIAPTWDTPRLYAYDAKTGEELYSFEVQESTLSKYDSHQLYEVIISDNVAYVASINQIFAFSLPSGQKIWEYNKTLPLTQYVIKEVGDIVLSSDLIYAIDQHSANIFALNKDTGKKIWQFDSLDGKYFTGLIIADKTLFASTLTGDLYALKSEYASPKILNQETNLDDGKVGIELSEPSPFPYGKIEQSFEVTAGQWPYSWSVVSGSLPPGLTLEIDEDKYHAYLLGIPTTPGQYTFTIKVADAQGNSDSKEFKMRILPDSKEFTSTLQQGLDGYDGVIDSYICSYSADNNYGDNINLESYTNRKPLIKFKIFEKEGGPIPDDAFITNASLSLYMHYVSGSSDKLNVYELLREWSEDEVNWNQASLGMNWDTSGADNQGTDRGSAIPIDSLQINSGYFHIFDLTDSVKRYASGELTNNGWILSKTGLSNSKLFKAYSSEYSDDITLRPKLEISYYLYNPNNQPPTAKLYFNPSIVLSGTNVVLDGSASYDPDGLIVEYAWISTPYNSFSCTDFNASTPWLCKRLVTIFCWFGMCVDEAEYTETLTVYDDYGTKKEVSKTITVVNSFDTTRITTEMLHDGYLGKSYFDTIYVEGGQEPYNYSIISGNLPDGLTLDVQTGVITGIPTKEGTYIFTAQVTDSQNKTTNQELSITISQPTTPTIITGDLNNDQKVNSTDFALLIQKWLQTSSITNEDLNNDGKIDTQDLGIIMSHWQE